MNFTKFNSRNCLYYIYYKITTKEKETNINISFTKISSKQNSFSFSAHNLQRLLSYERKQKFYEYNINLVKWLSPQELDDSRYYV